jgi:malate synthase
MAVKKKSAAKTARGGTRKKPAAGKKPGQKAAKNSQSGAAILGSVTAKKSAAAHRPKKKAALTGRARGATATPNEGEKSSSGGKLARPRRVRVRPSGERVTGPQGGFTSRRARSMPLVEAPSAVVIGGGAMAARFDEILTAAALAFLADLHRRFEPERRHLLAQRQEQQKRFDAGVLPDFRPETRAIRDADWQIAPIPTDLLDRRVEITGPVDRKMIINALNSGANVFMADFEDATSPIWANLIEGQINLKDRWDGKIDFIDPSSGKPYRLSASPALLMIRPRGWHLPEVHLSVDGEPISGALFDFGLYVFHNARKQIASGATPAFYLPKLENQREARLWNEVFNFAERSLAISPGTLKATVLIETLPAAFEMDEIIYELREHMAGLNCGRWDYIFSFIKRVGKNPKYLTPDRASMVMGKAFLNAYSLLLIKTCHRRGAFAMGGMAAQIPVKNDPVANEMAFAKVRADKEREAAAGHDGTWVAHPDLVAVAKQVFDRLPGSNQLDRRRDDVHINQADLLQMHEGNRTEQGLRENIRVGVQYIEAWLRGRGAVPLYNLMEDAATAEISRTQIWQWLWHRAKLDDGRTVTRELFRTVLADEMANVRASLGAMVFEKGRFDAAIKLFSDLSLAPQLEEFLTLPAYRLLAPTVE